MDEAPFKPAKPPFKALCWSVGCFLLKLVIDTILNKYAARIPAKFILVLSLLPLILFSIWGFNHEKSLVSAAWLKARFRSRPVSFCVVVVFVLATIVDVVANVKARYFSQASKSPSVIAQAPVQAAAPKSPADNAPRPDVVLRQSRMRPRVSERGHVALQEAQSVPPVSRSLNQGIINNGPVVGSDQLVQQMSNSPGGIQAGRDLTIISQPPAPHRELDPVKLGRANELLKQAPQGTAVFFITYPTATNPHGEIATFEKKLMSMFAEAGWRVYHERNYEIGEWRFNSSRGEGIGCSPSSKPTEYFQLAAKALAAIGYPCMHPSVFEEPQGLGLPYVIYISVGAIEPDI